jgi:hypothetical protein
VARPSSLSAFVLAGVGESHPPNRTLHTTLQLCNFTAGFGFLDIGARPSEFEIDVPAAASQMQGCLPLADFVAKVGFERSGAGVSDLPLDDYAS